MYINIEDNGTAYFGIVNLEKNQNKTSEILNYVTKKERVKFYSVEYSYEYLKQYQDKINEFWTTNNLHINLTSVSEEENKVIIRISSEYQEEIEKLKSNIYEKLIKIESSSGPIKARYRAKNEYGTPYMAGQEIDNYDIGMVCTSSFMVKKDNSAFQLTAGHCGNYGNTIKTGGTTIGQISKSRFSMNGISDSTAIFIPISEARSYLWGTTNGVQNIFADVETPDEDFINQEVCKSGIETGTTCGPLKYIDVSVGFDANNDGYTNAVIYHQRGAKFNNADGDSGGPVFTVVGSEKRKISGILSSGTMVDSELIGFYIHVTWALQDLGFNTWDVLVTN